MVPINPDIPMSYTKYKSLFALSCLTLSCSLFAAEYPTLGKIVSLDPKFDELVDKGAQMEVISSGYDWSEGPAWNKEEGFLVWSDVPENKIFKWSEKEGTSVFLEPSGYTGVADPEYKKGSNGLIYNNEGLLVIAETGDRRVSVLPPRSGRVTIADAYQNKRFNSPNDLAIDTAGNLYLTDPVYGLRGKWEDPDRELDIAGVYLIRTNGEVELLTDELRWPNGVGLSPNEDFLYVAQSSRDEPWIMKYPLNEDLSLGKGEVFFDVSTIQPNDGRLADGFAVDQEGNLWTSGPNGVLVISPEGKLLGRMMTGQATGNCCWGDDGSTLYITADYYICRIRTNAVGVGF